MKGETRAQQLWHDVRIVLLIQIAAAIYFLFCYIHDRIKNPQHKVAGEDAAYNKINLTAKGKNVLCLFNLIHIVWYFMLTVLFPDAWWVILTTGILWEIMEYTIMGWGDWRDFICNAVGILVGYLVAKVAIPYTEKQRTTGKMWPYTTKTPEKQGEEAK